MIRLFTVCVVCSFCVISSWMDWQASRTVRAVPRLKRLAQTTLSSANRSTISTCGEQPTETICHSVHVCIHNDDGWMKGARRKSTYSENKTNFLVITWFGSARSRLRTGPSLRCIPMRVCLQRIGVHRNFDYRIPPYYLFRSFVQDMCIACESVATTSLN